MKHVFLLIAAISIFALSAKGGTLSAEQILTPAGEKASAEQKAIFLHFGASWCGWCKKLDAFFDRDDIKSVFEKYFVPVKLVVQENAKNKGLENPGADELLKKLGGPGGLPYFAFLDPKGDLIVNSKKTTAGFSGEGSNIGYPSEPAEIEWFVGMIKKAAPKISGEDLKKIESALRSAKSS